MSNPLHYGVLTPLGWGACHAAIVAHELGISRVVNARTGTPELRTGDRVRVDGASGGVELLHRPS